jgi:hypothetical protein
VSIDHTYFESKARSVAIISQIHDIIEHISVGKGFGANEPMSNPLMHRAYGEPMLLNGIMLTVFAYGSMLHSSGISCWCMNKPFNLARTYIGTCLPRNAKVKQEGVVFKTSAHFLHFLIPRTSAADRSVMPERSFAGSTLVGPPFLYTPALMQPDL